MPAQAALREAFSDAILAYDSWESDEQEPRLSEYGDTPISRVFGLLWNCADIMPNRLCGWVREYDSYFDRPFPDGASYAQAARRMLRLVKSS